VIGPGPAPLSEGPPGALGRLQPIDALIGLVGVLFGLFVFGTIAAGVVTTDPARALIAQAVQVTVFVGIPLLVATARSPTNSEAVLGLTPFRRGDLWWVAGALFVQLIATALYSVLIEVPEQDNIAEDLGINTSILATVSAGLLIVVGAAVSEEILFRGLIFGALRSYGPFWLAALFSSALFGLVHLPNGSLAVVILLSLFGWLLAYLYERTGSIGPSIVLHGLNNALAFGVLLL
jgi:uncharacterized protein